MDLPQFQIARTDLKDYRRPILSQHAHVEVALIDRSHGGVLQHLFQLNHESVGSLDRLKQEIAFLPHDAFAYLGDVEKVDLDKKCIFLTDNNLITYKYLIIVSSSCQEGAYHAFLPTLKDALLLEALNAKAKIAHTWEAQDPAAIHAQAGKEDPKLGPVMQKQIKEANGEGAPQPVVPKRLCQVKT